MVNPTSAAIVIPPTDPSTHPDPGRKYSVPLSDLSDPESSLGNSVSVKLCYSLFLSHVPLLRYIYASNSVNPSLSFSSPSFRRNCVFKKKRKITKKCQTVVYQLDRELSRSSVERGSLIRRWVPVFSNGTKAIAHLSNLIQFFFFFFLSPWLLLLFALHNCRVEDV